MRRKFVSPGTLAVGLVLLAMLAIVVVVLYPGEITELVETESYSPKDAVLLHHSLADGTELRKFTENVGRAAGPSSWVDEDGETRTYYLLDFGRLDKVDSAVLELTVATSIRGRTIDVYTVSGWDNNAFLTHVFSKTFENRYYLRVQFDLTELVRAGHSAFALGTKEGAVLFWTTLDVDGPKLEVR
jgi:hypothetical protein